MERSVTGKTSRDKLISPLLLGFLALSKLAIDNKKKGSKRLRFRLKFVLANLALCSNLLIQGNYPKYLGHSKPGGLEQ